MLHFFIGAILFQFAIVGMDRMMTGVVKPDIEKQTFLTYVFWFTFMVEAVSYLTTSMYWYMTPNPSYIIAILLWVTITWTWIGGTLDFLYWMMGGKVPPWEDVLWWMPFKPQLWQWGVYTICWWIALVISWNVLPELF